MDEPEIRSYHRVATQELELYSIGDLRLPRPLPARGVFWFAIAELLMLVASVVPPTSLILGAVGWEITFLIAPALLAALFSIANPEGRRLHVALRALAKYAFRPRYLAGGYLPVQESERWRPTEIRTVRDRRP